MGQESNHNVLPRACPWQLSAGRAQLQSALLRLSVDLTRLRQGLHDVSYGGCALAGIRLLQLTIPGLPDHLPDASGCDAYVRGEDLVATYATTAHGQFTPQVYWRYRQSAAAAGLELILSMRTDRLHSDPTLTSASELPAEEILRADAAEGAAFQPLVRDADAAGRSLAARAPAALLFRLAGGSVSYVEMVYPGDLHGCWLDARHDPSDGWACGYRLLQENLEKGVIRRARVAGWFLPRDDDERVALSLLHEFLQSPPPLTT